jgi:hypothetical protein
MSLCRGVWIEVQTQYCPVLIKQSVLSPKGRHTRKQNLQPPIFNILRLEYNFQIDRGPVGVPECLLDPIGSNPIAVSVLLDPGSERGARHQIVRMDAQESALQDTLVGKGRVVYRHFVLPKYLPALTYLFSTNPVGQH